MKPAPFAYCAPSSVDEALAVLAELGADATPLAGGQSLVPLMNLRAEQPRAVVDLNRIEELAGIALEGGWLSIGALVRERTVERSPVVAEHALLLQLAVEHIAYPAVRMRGTIGGSLAYADPAAEIVCALLALDARVVLRSAAARREIAVDDFIVGPYSTSREPAELVTEIRVPVAGPGAAAGFAEVARKHSDFAIGLASAVVTVEAGACSRVRLAIGGAGTVPRRCRTAEERMTGKPVTAALLHEVGEVAAGELDVVDTQHGSADYKRDVFAVQATRALSRACWPELELAGGSWGEAA